MEKKNWSYWCTLLVLFIPLFSPAQETGSAGSVVARAGKVFISEQEFVERFELLPAFGRHRKSQLEEKKLELLYSMIAEKLMAQKAMAWGMDRDSLLRRGIGETTKLFARDELYREEIIRKVSVTPQEIVQGIAAAQVELVLQYIFLGSLADAGFIRSRIKNAGDFSRLRIDSSYHAQRDTVTLVWGEADQHIEEAAYAMRKDDISPVIAAGGGFFIVKLVSARPNSFFSGMTPDVLRERVTTALRRRKERARLDEYVAEVLRDKIGFARPSPMRLLAEALRSAYQDGDRDSLMFLTPARVARVRAQCMDAMKDTLAIAGPVAIFVEDVVYKLVGKAFGVPRDAIPSIPSRLNTEVKIIVQQELLAQEALHRRLDEVPEVRRAIDMWWQYYLAGAVKDSVRRAIHLTDAEVWAVMKYRDTSVTIPQVQIRELRTTSPMDMQAALEDINQGASLEKAVQKWSVDPDAKAHGGLSGFFAVTERPPIGDIAGALRVGERFGPIATEGGQLYFEVVAKKSAPLLQDTAFAARFARAHEDALTMKARHMLSNLLAGTGKEMGFDVYTDRLRKIEVSPIPMMTFRILGFGGKMIAVPFVDPQLDWLGVEQPENIVP